MRAQLSIDQQFQLIKPVTKAEVKEALKSISDIQSPDPDGYGSGFFKQAWDVIEDDLCSAALEFFSTGQLLKSFNRTVVVLIPKLIDPRGLEDYRPITCCSTFYKCLSKILCLRLQSAFLTLIDENQAALWRSRVFYTMCL